MKNNSTKNTTIILLSIVIISGALFIYTRGILGRRVHMKIEESAGASIRNVIYTCADNIQVEAMYDNSNLNETKAIITTGDIKNRMMITTTSASGAKYTDGTYVWWTKGTTGFLTEASASQKVLVNGCVIKQ